jgi:transposase
VEVLSIPPCWNETMTFYLGIDVGCKSLDVAIFTPGATAATHIGAYANDSKGVKRLLRDLAKTPITHALLVATGGYENAALDQLSAHMPITRIASHRSAAFARSLGQYAKSDPVDARTLARWPPAPFRVRMRHPRRPAKPCARW